VFAGLAVVACLMPVQNDTWWHLRAGHDMLRDHALMFADRFSHTTGGGFFWNHSWLAQLAFYPIFVLGGLPLLTAFCALLVVLGWAMVWRLTRGPEDLRVLLLVLAVASSTAVWSVRPQVFSVVLLPIVTSLVARDRWLLVAPLMVLWANLHAGMAMGASVAGASVLAALVADRDRLVMRVAGAAAVFGATLLTPLGPTNWTEMLASMARSRANQIQEWRATPLPPDQLLFWGLAAVVVWQVVRRWRALESPEDRVLVAAALVALPLAARTFRNVPTFMMLATPALTRLTWRSGAERDRADRRHHTLRFAAAGLVAMVGVVIVWRAWTTPWAMLGWRPMSPEAAHAIATCRGPLYNNYESGGPIIWFAPDQPVFVDSRQDPFPISLVQAASGVEDTGDYATLFETWHINCAALPPASPTISHLSANGWVTRFMDHQWVVLERPIPTSTAARPSSAP
jgi:hypothetical protein